MKQNITVVEFPSKSTSTAVQQLYAKFQNLKQRISNTDSKRSSRSIERRPFVQKQKDLKYARIGTMQSVNLSSLMGQLSDGLKEDSSERRMNKLTSSDSITVRKQFTHYMQTILQQVQQQYMRRTQTLVNKLSTMQQKLARVSLVIKQQKKHQQSNYQKINSSFTQNVNNTTRCHTFKSLSQNTIQNHFLSSASKVTNEELEQRHVLEMRSIIENYQNRISAILQGRSDTSGRERSLSNCQYLSYGGIGEGKKLEELMVSKEKEVRQLTGENKKLKRMLQQVKINFERNGELNKLLKEENKMLEVTVEKLQAGKRQLQLEKRNDQGEMQKVRAELKIRNLEMKRLKEEVERMNLLRDQVGEVNQVKFVKVQPVSFKEIYQKNQQVQRVNNRTGEKSSQIEVIDTDRSEDINDACFVININKSKIEQKLITKQIIYNELQQLKQMKRSRSQVINKNQLSHIQSLSRQSELISEVNLFQQQNRLLKWKKDKFQSQLKKAQDDEDMMQQQLGRLNQQIRRLNGYCHLLDQCGFKLLKAQSLLENQVTLLENQSKLKQEFFKQKEKKKRGFSLRR